MGHTAGGEQWTSEWNFICQPSLLSINCITTWAIPPSSMENSSSTISVPVAEKARDYYSNPTGKTHTHLHTHAPHSSTFAWKIPWMEKPGGLQSMGLQRVEHNWATSLSLSCIGEVNGNPLQCSCLENPRDGGAWWAAVYGVSQSQTRLKQFSSSSNIHQYTWIFIIARGDQQTFQWW